MFGKADRGAKAGVIGHPFGEPGRRETERAGGDDHVHADRARGQNLFPFGDLLVWRCAGDRRNDQRRAGEAAQLLCSGGLVQIGLVCKADLKREPACTVARSPREDQEPPGRELAMIRHARGDRQDCGEFVSARSRPSHHRRRDRRRRLRISIVSFMGILLKRSPLLGRKPVRRKPPLIRLNVWSPAATATKHRRHFSTNARRVDSDLANSGGFGRADGVGRARRRSNAGERIRPGDAQSFRGPWRRRAAHRRVALAGVRRAGRSGRLASLDC